MLGTAPKSDPLCGSGVPGPPHDQEPKGYGGGLDYRPGCAYAGRMRHLLVILLFVSGCVTADVVSSEGDTHVLRIERMSDSDAWRVNIVMAKRAREICPLGWEIISNRTEPSGENWALQSTHHFERTIRCL